MKRIKITASRWHQRTPEGYIQRSAGDVIEVEDREAERLINAGAATPSRAKLTDPEAAGGDEPATEQTPDTDDEAPVSEIVDEILAADTEPSTEPSTDLAKPKATDTTDMWVAYAISQGMPEDEAKALNRTELRKHYS